MEELIKEIDQYLIDNKISESAFGKTVLNDPAFVLKLRRGRDCKYSTMQKVREYIGK